MRVLLPLFVCLLVPQAALPADTAVTHLSAREVAEAIGAAPAGAVASVPLTVSPEYRVLGIRRTAAGESELHENEIDIWYVIEGQCTLVTGGAMVKGKITAPGEVRGSGIDGGDTREVGKGDVVTIAAGVPHWVRQVQAPIQYLVIKVPRKP
jgi:mannose-6-phosphate isomerase-like protein (cupin superfamily)